MLLTLGGTAPRIRAGITYVVVSLLSSLVFLAAIALVYAATGTVNMAQLAVRLGELPDGHPLVLQLMLLIAFCIKAAVFPLSAWLPDSYPTAPAPVTAVFAGLLTKVGVYAIIRTQTLLFPGGALDDVLLWAALATMVVGILGAVAQTDIKRMLSFTLVSHIGYMIFGVALATTAGLAGAIFYVVHHITIQTTLFLVAGLVERRGGVDRRWTGSAGWPRASPLLAVLFFVPAMNLAGIPPLSGFIGKLGLLQAGRRRRRRAGAAAGRRRGGHQPADAVAIARVWNRAFWRPPAQQPRRRHGRRPRPRRRPRAREPPPSRSGGARARDAGHGSGGGRPPGGGLGRHTAVATATAPATDGSATAATGAAAAPAAAGDGRRDRGDGGGDRGAHRAGGPALRGGRPGRGATCSTARPYIDGRVRRQDVP